MSMMFSIAFDGEIHATPGTSYVEYERSKVRPMAGRKSLLHITGCAQSFTAAQRAAGRPLRESLDAGHQPDAGGQMVCTDRRSDLRRCDRPEGGQR